MDLAALSDALSADPRQKDRELAPSLVLGHPMLSPVRAAARVPIAVSIALAVAVIWVPALAPGLHGTGEMMAMAGS